MSVSSDRAWAAIREIGRLDVWFPTIATCRIAGDGVGAYRHMTLHRGGDIVDRIMAIDEARRRLTYERQASPFPVTSYRGTVEVFESFDSSAVVVWTVDFESKPEDATAVADALTTGIGAGVAGMDHDLRGQASARQG